MLLNIAHTTRYQYDRPVSYALQRTRLRPLDDIHQTVQNWEIVVDGGVVEASYFDHYGNATDLISVDSDVREVTLTARGTVETLSDTGVLGHVFGVAPLWHFQQPTPLTMPGKLTRALADKASVKDDPVAGLHDLSASVIAQCIYQTGATDSNTTGEQALKGGAGVCQDHAHIFMAAARLRGFPARYVAGYLMMNDRVDQDASHAWAEVYVDTLGWVGFDVSNGYSPDGRYVRVAIGRDARDASPVTGLRIGASKESMVVTLQVQQ